MRRDTPSPDPVRHLGSTATYSFGYVLVTSLLGGLAAIALVLAVLYPVTAAGVGALAGGSAFATRLLRQRYREWERTEGTRHVCVPKTGVCVRL